MIYAYDILKYSDFRDLGKRFKIKLKFSDTPSTDNQNLVFFMLNKCLLNFKQWLLKRD